MVHKPGFGDTVYYRNKWKGGGIIAYTCALQLFNNNSNNNINNKIHRLNNLTTLILT